MVVRRSIDGLGADESELVRGSFNVPKGDWTLRVTVDALGEVSELDEEDIAWTYEAHSTGGGSAAAIAAAGGVGILALVTVLLRRRGGSKDDVEAALPTAPGPTSKPKPRGPPGAERRVAGGPRAPPAPPKQANVDLSRAEAALAALSPNPAPEGLPAVPDIGAVASDHTELPGGGEYDYTTEGTHYHGEGLGRWKLRDDGSFERVA